MIFRPVTPVSPSGPPMTNRGRVDENLGLLIQVAAAHRLDDLFQDEPSQIRLRDVGDVLLGDDHGLKPHGLPVGILHGDLALAVGAHGVIGLVLANVRQLGGQPMGQHDRQGHQLRRLVAGEAEHHALVAGALLVLGGFLDPPGDVAALAVNRDPNAGVLTVDAVARVRVSDLPQRVPDDLLDVGVARRRDLAGDMNRAGRRQGLDGRVRVRVLLQQVIEDGVADLVADLVRVTFGHTLAGEEVSFCHRGPLSSRT